MDLFRFALRQFTVLTSVGMDQFLPIGLLPLIRTRSEGLDQVKWVGHLDHAERSGLAGRQFSVVRSEFVEGDEEVPLDLSRQLHVTLGEGTVCRVSDHKGYQSKEPRRHVAVSLWTATHSAQEAWYGDRLAVNFLALFKSSFDCT